MNNFGKGISLSTGFDLNAPLPLDAKSVVNTIEEMKNLVTSGLVCHGQTTYVEETKAFYQYTGDGENDGWAEFSSLEKIQGVLDETKNKLESDMKDLETGLSNKIIISANELRSEFEDVAAGFLPSIKEDMNGIRAELTATTEQLSSQIAQTERDLIILEQTAEGFTTRIDNMEQDLRGEITATAGELRSEFSQISGGDFSSISQKVDKIQADVVDMDERLTSSITQTAESIRTEVANFKTETTSSITQMSDRITSEVSTLDGKYTELKQTVDNFKIEAGDSEALNAKLELTKEELKTEISNLETNMNTKINQTAESITSSVTELDGKYTQLKQTVDNFKIEAGDGEAIAEKLAEIELTADKINWLVKSGTSASNMEMTDEAISLIASKVQIEAGEINLEGYTTINGGFKIDEDGNMIAKDGEFEGTITGSTITGSSINNGNGTFSVSSSGKLVATEAEIEGKITATSGTFKGTVTGSKVEGSKISGGSITIGDNFEVDSDGDLTATNANIKGKIEATSGSFKGDIKSGSTITGATISGSTITTGNNFKVDSSGKLTATNASISGAITATSGSFTGTINASSGTFKGEIKSGSTITGATISGGSINIGSGNFTVSSSGNLATNSTIKANGGIYTKGDFVGDGYGVSIRSTGSGMHAYVKSESGGVKLQPGPGKEVHCGVYDPDDPDSVNKYSNFAAAKIVANGDIYGHANLTVKSKLTVGDSESRFNQKVVIGTSSNNQTLYCHGSISAVDGFFHNGSWVGSDRTLKENINYISNANTIRDEDISLSECYDFVKDLALATYNYIDDNDKRLKLGFITQDILCNEDQSDNKVGQMIVGKLRGINISDNDEEQDCRLAYDSTNALGVILATLQVIINKIEQLENK